ncbi:MAG: hypothetical protein ACI9CD_000134 [Candidatus Deianiraeaceae bacterium]|jgi:hypothetical protein
MSEDSGPSHAIMEQAAQATASSQQGGGGQAGLDKSITGEGAVKIQNVTGGASLTEKNVAGKIADPLDMITNRMDTSVGKLNPFEGLQTAEMSPVKDMHASSGISSINTLTKGAGQGQG